MKLQLLGRTNAVVLVLMSGCHTLTMAIYFESITRTDMPKQKLFDLSRSIDAHKDSMAGSREKAVAGVTSGLISLGEEVTWRAWHFGLPIRMTSRITEMQAPDRFVDEQVQGPFRRFRHVHEFSQDLEGTTMIDRIEFEIAGGILGRLVEKLLLVRYVQHLIDLRNKHLIS
jgi:ligand-binding SRPBCC domain-containing protein